MEAGPPVPKHSTHLLPAPEVHVGISDDVDDNVLPPHGIPPAYHVQAGGQPPGSSPVPNPDHDFFHAGAQTFLNSDCTHLPHPTGAGYCLSLDHTTQAIPPVVHETNPSGQIDILVYDPPGGVGIGGMTGPSAGPSQPGINSIDSRKRKRPTTRDEPSERNRTRKIGQPHPEPQQAPIQVRIQKFRPAQVQPVTTFVFR